MVTVDLYFEFESQIILCAMHNCFVHIKYDSLKHIQVHKLHRKSQQHRLVVNPSIIKV